MSRIEADRTQSEFNMAVAWLNRLNYWFYVCDEHSHNLDVFNWFQTLMILFRELSTEIDKTKYNEHKTSARVLFQTVNKHVAEKNRKGVAGISPDLYWELHDFEEFLRIEMDKSGLLKKAKEDAAKALQG